MNIATRLIVIPMLLALCLCPSCAPTDFGGGNDNPPTDDNDGMPDDNGMPAQTVSQLYDPSTPLVLETSGITLDVPSGATLTSVTFSIDLTEESELPKPLPGNVSFSGATFASDGQNLLQNATVSIDLSEESIASKLPVLTFDNGSNDWIGTGGLADVTNGGLRAQFDTNDFAILGVPDPVPLPPEGETPPSTFALVQGVLVSNAINSNEASLLYSKTDSGSSFNITVNSQEVNPQQQVENLELDLDAIEVSLVGNYVVGIVGGPGSAFWSGGVSESVIGVMIMSIDNSTANVTIFVTTPERVISGTLEGTEF